MCCLVDLQNNLIIAGPNALPLFTGNLLPRDFAKYPYNSCSKCVFTVCGNTYPWWICKKNLIIAVPNPFPLFAGNILPRDFAKKYL